MGKSDEVRRMLDECGIEYNVVGPDEFGKVVYFDLPDGREVGFTDFYDGHTQLRIWDCTPTQAIAATVGGNVDLGVVDADLVAIADWQHDYASEWADGYDGYGVDGLSKDAIEKLDELVTTAQSHITEVAKHATVVRSCSSCPEMDNPDSYISHLQSALKWHDEHVPRPTNPRNTCVVLEGEKVPEEVLFIGANGVTHYLPEATCKQEDWSTEGDHARVWLTCGHDCMVETVADLPKFCQECGAKVVTE